MVQRRLRPLCGIYEAESINTPGHEEVNELLCEAVSWRIIITNYSKPNEKWTHFLRQNTPKKSSTPHVLSYDKGARVKKVRIQTTHEPTDERTNDGWRMKICDENEMKRWMKMVMKCMLYDHTWWKWNAKMSENDNEIYAGWPHMRSIRSQNTDRETSGQMGSP